MKFVRALSIIIEKHARQKNSEISKSLSLNDSGGQQLDGAPKHVGIVDVYCELLLLSCFHGVHNL